jgi:hypothetical protein
MTIMILLLELVTATWPFQGLEPTICRESYSSTAEAHVLPESEFNLESLTAYFREALKKRTAYEHTVLVTSDARVLEELRGWKPVVGPMYALPRITPLVTAAPMARLFRLGENAFFEYRDRQGGTGWVTLQGENLFLKSLEGVSVRYYGQEKRGSRDFGSGEQRILVLVAPEMARLSESSIAQLFALYEERFSCPEILEIRLYEHPSDACADSRIFIPGFEFLPAGDKEIRETRGHLTVYYRGWTKGRPKTVIVR